MIRLAFPLITVAGRNGQRGERRDGASGLYYPATDRMAQIHFESAYGGENRAELQRSDGLRAECFAYRGVVAALPDNQRDDFCRARTRKESTKPCVFPACPQKPRTPPVTLESGRAITIWHSIVERYTPPVAHRLGGEVKPASKPRNYTTDAVLMTSARWPANTRAF